MLLENVFIRSVWEDSGFGWLRRLLSGKQMLHLFLCVCCHLSALWLCASLCKKDGAMLIAYDHMSSSTFFLSELTRLVGVYPPDRLYLGG